MRKSNIGRDSQQAEVLGARELHLGQKAAALLGKDDGQDRSVPMVPAFFQVCWDHQAETGPQEAAECQMGSPSPAWQCWVSWHHASTNRDDTRGKRAFAYCRH